MADQFTHFVAQAEASEAASSHPRPRRRSWRAPALGMLSALVGAIFWAPTPVSASAPVHVTSLQQNAGPESGGVTVTIQGSGFQGGAQVKFGSRSVVGSVANAGSMTAVAPDISPSYGALAVEVDNPDGGRSPEHFWFNYYELVPGRGTTSAAHAASHALPGDAQVDLFARWNDNTLHHTFHTNVQPAWAAWESLGGVLTSSPSAVSWGNQNRIDVVARGSDNAAWHTWWNGTSWGGWESLGGILTYGPLVTSWGTGRLDVFASGTDFQLWHRYFAGTWSGWEPLGGSLGAAPGGVSWGPNRIDIFIQGPGETLSHKWWNVTQWGGWESLGGTIVGQPAAASTGVGDLEVYAGGPGLTPDVFHLPFSGTWQAWRAEGTYWNGQWGWDPGAVSRGSGQGVDLFGIGTEGAVWHTVTAVALPSTARIRGGTASGGRR
jgi:hypothetical protein